VHSRFSFGCLGGGGGGCGAADAAIVDMAARCFT